MPTRRTLLIAGVVAPIAVAGAGAAGVAAASESGAGPQVPLAAAPPGPNLVGYTATGSRTVEQLDQLTGRVARAVRVFHPQGTPVPTALNAKLLTYLGPQQRNVVYSLKVPDSSAATRAACASLAADIAARGYAGKVRIILWHEPYPELSAAAFVDRYRALAPAIRSHGVACGACFHTYPIWRQGLDYTTYWPGDDLTDFLAIDTYPGDTPQGVAADPLATIAPLTSFAKGRGKIFGIGEFAVSADRAAADPEHATAWVARFAALGGSCRFTLYWNNGGQGLEENNGLLLPAYRQVFDRFAA